MHSSDDFGKDIKILKQSLLCITKYLFIIKLLTKYNS